MSTPTNLSQTLTDPRRIAFAGDWHMNAFWAREAIYHAHRKGADLLLHTGDFGFTFSTNFVKEVQQACEDFDMLVVFTDGNHDNHEWIWNHARNDLGFHVITSNVWAAPRGHRWTTWDKTFMAVGGAVSVDRQHRIPMVDWWPTERLTRPQARYATYGEAGTLVGGPLPDPLPADVMITHDCPSGVSIPGISFESGRKYFPEQALLEAEDHRILFRQIVDAVNPAVYVHGHYHVNYGFVDRATGTRYVGLDCDATSMTRNVWVVETPLELERGTG